MAERAARRSELPEHEEPNSETKEGGVVINLDELEDDKDKGKERKAKTGGEERGATEDDEGGLDAVNEDLNDDVRNRRREERKQRKEDRARRERELEARLESTENELKNLRAAAAKGQEAGLRREYESVESEMSRLQVAYREAKEAKEKAYKDGDAKTAVEADEIMASAKDRFSQLGLKREQIIQAAQEERRPKGVSPQLKQHAEAFMKEHDWYDIKGGDRDSARVIAIDRAMAAEGWDPNTKGYWEELRERVREDGKLAHRFEEDDDLDESERGGREREREREERPAPRKRQTTGGSDRDVGGGGARNQFFLSAARVAALKEAGMWEDVEKRNKMIRTYKARDEQERKRAQQGRR